MIVMLMHCPGEKKKCNEYGIKCHGGWIVTFGVWFGIG